MKNCLCLLFSILLFSCQNKEPRLNPPGLEKPKRKVIVAEYLLINTEREPLNLMNYRIGIACLINKSRIVEKLCNTSGRKYIQLHSLVPPEYPEYPHKQKEHYPFNVSSAIEHLFMDVTLEDSQKEKYEIITLSSGSNSYSPSEEMQLTFKDYGFIESNISVLPEKDIISKIQDKKFDLAIIRIKNGSKRFNVYPEYFGNTLNIVGLPGKRNVDYKSYEDYLIKNAIAIPLWYYME